MSSTEVTSAVNTFLVFVYGTLKRGEPNHDVLTEISNGHASFISRAKTFEKWPLVIASRYNIPFLLFYEGKGHNVIGEIYRVDKQMLEKLDDFESHPVYYERVEKRVQLIPNDKSNNNPEYLTVWIYFLKDYKNVLLDKPFLEDYSSNGFHGLPYVSRYMRNEGDYWDDVKNEDTNDPEDIYT